MENVVMLHAVVLDYGDEEDYKMCFVCDTEEEAERAALEMGGDHKYRQILVREKIKKYLN